MLLSVFILKYLLEYTTQFKFIYYTKIADGKITMYYLDGAKLLGEDRSDGVRIRYFYDAGGIIGFSYKEGDAREDLYTYIKDGFGNIIMIEDVYGNPIARYDYDLMGNSTVTANFFGEWMKLYNNIPGMSEAPEWRINCKIAELNPIRWRSFYYDHESGYYYANGRYYDPGAGVYVDADHPENIVDYATVIGGLDPNIITLDNHLTIASAGFNIFTTDGLSPDMTYDPDENVSWWEKNWLQVILNALQIIAGFLLCFVPCMRGIGKMLIFAGIMGFAMMGLEAISPALAKIAGGLSGMANGLAAVKTGLALFSLGPVGAIAGLICIVVGAATMAVGFNDAVNGATGTNYIREWTGMSEEAYANLRMTLNIASTVCTMAGNVARYFRGSRCFIAGTLVACLGLDGKECKKKIEDVEVGDEVLAFDEETGKLAYRKVVQLFRNKSKDWTGVTIGGNEIVSTPGHKYYLPENEVCREVGEKHEHADYEELSVKWVSACNLKIGDKVLLSTGEYGIVEKVRSIHYDIPQTTYNFEVEGYHTYFVGENSVCVHNTTVDCGGRNILENIKYTDKVKGQMLQDIDHGFPSMIDDIAGTTGKVGTFTGGDGVVRTAVELPGAINGRVGIYQYIIEPNGITVNHRQFVRIAKSLLGG